MSMKPFHQPEASPLLVSVGVHCNVGKERQENQDRITRSRTPFGDLFIVADGIGGSRGGSEAAQSVVDGFTVFLKSHGELAINDALQQAGQAIQQQLRLKSAADASLAGMGSTVVLCVVKGDRVTYAHAGDSRAYLLRSRQLQQLTSDHSMMERFVAQGVLTPEQAREHPDASVLTRAIGTSSDGSLDIGEMQLQPGDALLLCSDGLWGYVRHQEMELIAAAESLSAPAVADALLNLALEGGGGDNISIQFLRFQAAPLAVPPIKPRRMSTTMAIGFALALAMLLLVAGLFVWNYNHPLSTLVIGPAAKPVQEIERQASGTASHPSTTAPRSVKKQTSEVEQLKDDVTKQVDELAH
jgi:serine/threonine protein phosphatase PrpC